MGIPKHCQQGGENGAAKQARGSGKLFCCEYGRIIARCSAGGQDIGKVLIAEGLAWAFVEYSDEYVPLEGNARAQAVGVWQAETQTPWDFRDDKWNRALAEAPGGKCPIKGNIGAGNTSTVAPLFDKRVLMIGAESLGSEVALLLAKTGVGSITLVDPELLDYPNVGRNVLGVTQVRTYKANSLAEKLAGNFPHMLSIKYFAEDWQSLFGKRPDVFHNADLIVSTVGSWVAEGKLNQMARNEADFPPVIYGWAEPFAVAGHAVLIGSSGPCFACGMDRFGKALQSVCEWDAETTRKPPHCGASFQPYGPISLSGVAAFVAKTTTKALLGDLPHGIEAVYWALKEEIAEQGGRFNPALLNSFPDVPEFGGSRQFAWRQKDDCAFCEEA